MFPKFIVTCKNPKIKSLNLEKNDINNLAFQTSTVKNLNLGLSLDK